MGEDGLRLEREDTIARLVLARPGKRNAVSSGTWRALAAHATELADDPAVRVVVVTGDPPSFSAGADVAEFAAVFADEASAAAYNELVQDAMARLERLPTPTVAEIRGDCVGGGCGLALACDLRFCAEDARFAVTPARLGLAYGLGDVKRLIDLVGPSRAKDILFSARPLDAAEALRIGLVDRVVPPDQLARAVRTYAATLQDLSGNSQRLIKRIARLVLDGASEETEESRCLRDSAVAHADFVEGRRAFLEKRRPRFS
jgi:enoyl-CoA hydratase/carnithine racemase